MDLDISALIETVSKLVGENQDLHRQVKSLAKQNMKQARAMRQATKALQTVIDGIDCRDIDSGVIYNENGRIETICKMAQRKLDRATTGTL
jgi:hypothetical protein